MDWSTLLPFLQQNQPPTGGAPGSPIPNAVGPTSYGGPNGPAPLGILNGAQSPQDPAKQQQDLISQAQKLLSPQAPPQSLPQIQMAKPVGSQGINPLSFLAAFNKNPLVALSGTGS